MSYASAALVSNKMQKGEVYATVTSGQYRGTVGRVAKVKSHHYSKHSYMLDFPGRSVKFCGSILRECDAQEPVLLYDEDFVPTYLDFNEREINVGDRIVVCKRGDGGSADMLMGNVRKVNLQGVYFAPFAINGQFTNDKTKLVKLCGTSSVMIIDSSTSNAIMIQKLSAGSMD